VIACLQQARNRVDCGHAAGENGRGHAAFERREVLLEARAGGVGDARVLVAFVFADALLHVGGGGIDWDRDRAG